MASATSTRSADLACHDLLLRMAGRLPDELLWRLRDWLAAQARTTVGAMLPRELLRHRVGLTDDERELLVAAVCGWGASRRLVDAVLPDHVSDGPVPEFRPGPDWPDVTALAVLAVVREHPACRELRQAWRVGARREQRVMLVLGAEERPWVLAGTLARVLRAHGDASPCVEVLPSGAQRPAYHQAAIAASVSLWRPVAAPVGV